MLTLQPTRSKTTGPTSEPTIRPCPLCGTRPSRERALDGPIVTCPECDLLYRSLLQRTDEAEYWSGYVEQQAERAFDQLRLPFYQSYWTSLRGLVGSIDVDARQPRVLDVGCVPGTLLTQAIEDGWEAHGVELTSALCEVVRHHCSARVWEGRLETIDFVDLRFDLVVVGDVVRHAVDPTAFVERCHGLLRPNGTLVVREINAAHDRHTQRCASPNEFDMQFFTPATMTDLLHQSGFETIHTQSSPVSLLTLPWVMRFAQRWPAGYGVLIKAINLGLRTVDSLGVPHRSPPSFLSIGRRSA